MIDDQARSAEIAGAIGQRILARQASTRDVSRDESRWTELCPEVEPGDHVVFISTTDDYARLRTNDTGIVRFVDDLGTVHVAWDPDGHTLGLVPEVDVWRLLHPRWRGDSQQFFEVKGGAS